MTRRIWAGITCFIVLGLALAGFTGVTDYYDPHDAMYALVGHFVPKARYDAAEAYTHAIQRQDLPTINAMSDPSILDANFYKVNETLRVYIPAASPVSTGAIQYNVTAYSDGRRVSTLVINHIYPNGGAMLTTTRFNEVNGKVEGIIVQTITAADLQKVRFDPLAANSTQMGLLVLALVMIGFTTFTLYHCLSAPKLRFKWLWFIFITAGIGSLRVNWLTLATQVAPIDIHWGAAGIYQLLFNPATIYFNVPLGAIVFWLIGRSRARNEPSKAL